MKITNLTKVFAVTSALLSSAYFAVVHLLVSLTNERNGKLILGLAIVFTGLWLALGVAFLRKENKRDSKLNMGMLYHLIASTILIISSFTAYLVERKHFQAINIAWAVGISFVSLVTHVISQKNSLKGIRKHEVFQ